MEVEIFLKLFISINFFVIGTLFGSFFSLAIYRLPRKQDILVTRSYCPNCKHNLSFFDLIPVLSYIFSLGKCRYCHQNISKRYILLELANGVIFLTIYLTFGLTILTLIILCIYILLFVLIGSYVMKNNMSDEKKLENSLVIKKNENEYLKDKLKNKRGIFISEIVVASIVFAMLFVSTIITLRNYTKKSVDSLKRTSAFNLAVYNTEKCLATNYINLDSYSYFADIDNTRYYISANIDKYSDTDLTKKDIIKKINIQVKYEDKNKENSIVIDTLKYKEREKYE